MRTAAFVAVAVLCLGLSAASGDYIENFDSMGTTGTAPPTGWTIGYLGASGSVNRAVMEPYAGNGKAITSLTLRVSNGTEGSGTPYALNLGSTGSSDRALGNFPRTSPYGDHIMQVVLTNDTSYDWTAIDLAYTCEQWKIFQCTSSSGKPEKLRVLYSDSSATSGFVYMGTAFDGNAAKDTPANTVVDGNLAENRVTVSGQYTLPNVLHPGDSFWIRWHDWNDNQTSDHILGIDDVSITGIPEPATMALLALGGLAVLRRRRKA